MWAVGPSRDWVEVGITTGNTQKGYAFRDWYVARFYSGIYEEFLPATPAPSRTGSYPTTSRYNGTDWEIFRGGTLISRLGVPDVGYINYADVGGEITNGGMNESGAQTKLYHTPSGGDPQSGWPGIIEILAGSGNPYTSASVVTTTTSVTHRTIVQAPCL